MSISKTIESLFKNSWCRLFLMIFPLASFVLGVLILVYTVPFWRALFGPLPAEFTRSDLVLSLLGYSLIALALILGLIGYLGHFSGELLRPMRVAMGVLGLVVLSYQFVEMNARR